MICIKFIQETTKCNQNRPSFIGYIIKKLGLFSGDTVEAELLPIEVLHCGNRDCRRFCSRDLDIDPMTFIHELEYLTRRIVWRYTG